MGREERKIASVTTLVKKTNHSFHRLHSHQVASVFLGNARMSQKQVVSIV